MKRFLIIGFSLFMLTGCTGFTATYENGTHWGLIDSATGHKCLDVNLGEGKIEVTGLMKYIDGFLVEGKNLTYKSYGKMCEKAPGKVPRGEQ